MVYSDTLLRQSVSVDKVVTFPDISISELDVLKAGGITQAHTRGSIEPDGAIAFLVSHSMVGQRLG